MVLHYEVFQGSCFGFFNQQFVFLLIFRLKFMISQRFLFFSWNTFS